MLYSRICGLHQLLQQVTVDELMEMEHWPLDTRGIPEAANQQSSCSAPMPHDDRGDFQEPGRSTYLVTLCINLLEPSRHGAWLHGLVVQQIVYGRRLCLRELHTSLGSFDGMFKADST